MKRKTLAVLLVCVASSSVAEGDHIWPGGGHELPIEALADHGDICTGMEAVRRNVGDTANECFTPSAGGSAHIIEDETVPLAAQPDLNFEGAGVSCADDAGNTATVCTISGGGSPTFTDISAGTNTTAAMVVGTGSSLVASGSGTVDATEGDTATGFFDAGTIEYERGGIEADVNLYNGLIDISAGVTSEVADLAELNTALGGAGIVTGAHTADQVGTVNNGDYCQGGAASVLDCDVTAIPVADLDSTVTQTELNNLSGTNTGDNDQVGAVTNTEICQGDGALVQCDIGDLAALNTAIGSGLVTGAHTDATKLPLSGGTMTGALVADEQGVEFLESDDAVTCAAGDYWIRADLSDTTLKKCLNGVETDLDTSGGAPATADISDVSVTQTEFAELETLEATSISSGNWTSLSLLSGTNTGDQTINTADIADVLVTQDELEELETIGTTIISAADWTAVAALVGVNTGDEAVADLTTQGIIEIATGAETNTGTDATRAVSPDGLDDWTGSAQITTVGTLASPTLTTPVLGAAAATSITVTSQTECVMLDASGINCSTVGGCATTDEAGDNFDYATADFDSGDTDESGTWSFNIPDNITGTTFTAQVYWTSNDAACTNEAADDVCWTVAGSGIANDGDWDGATLGTAQGIEDVCIAVGDLMVSVVSDAVTHGWAADERAIVQITRDADASPHADCPDADDYPADARLLSLKICYEVDNVFSGE